MANEYGNYPQHGYREPRPDTRQPQDPRAYDPVPPYYPPTPPQPEPPARKSRVGGCILIALVFIIALGVLGFGITKILMPDPTGNWEDNLLMEGPDFSSLSDDTYLEDLADTPVFDSDIRRSEISTVTFLSTLKGAPRDAWDVSEFSDGSVLAWVTPDGRLYDLYIAGNGGVNGEYACQNLFAGYCNVTKIDFGDSFHTEKSKDMTRMFCGCASLKSLDVSCFDTRNVESMRLMFDNCSSMRKLDLSSFSTESVMDLAWMFSCCYELDELDISSFRTPAALTMQGMFDCCSSLETLDLDHFDTSSVLEMDFMFDECAALENLYISSFDTSSVQSMAGMFGECYSLQHLDVSHFDTAMVEVMGWMFWGCPVVSVEDVAHFDTSSVTDYEGFMDGTGWEYLFSGSSQA